MSRIVQYQSSFTMGEFDPLVKGRVDITQYQSALEKATNVVCIPQGALERRPGSQFILDVSSHLGAGITSQQGIRLIPFEFSTTDSFMLVFVKISTSSSNNVRMFVINSGAVVANINGSGNNYLTLSFGNISFDKLTFTQSADTLIIINEDLAPVKIVRGSSNTAWTASSITLTSPKYAFSENTTTPSGTVTASSIDGAADVTASGHVFHSGESSTAQAGASNTITLHSGASSQNDIYNGSTINVTGGTGSGQTRIISDYVGSSKVATVSENWTTAPDNTSTFTVTSMVGQYIQMINGFGRAKIIEVESSTKVKTNVEVPFYSTSAESNFELEFGYEDVFSADRGYPRSAVFHEGRLYFGGSKSLPSALFGSKVGDFFNFLESEGLDDDAIFALLSSDTVNAITGLRSGRDLQIFTSGNEWYAQQAESEPITPQNLTLKAATKSGSKENIMPVAAEGGTIFLQRSGKALREFLFSDVELSYQSNNISLLSSHLLKNPVKITFRRATSTDDGDLLIIVNGTDGTMAAYSIHRTQKVVAPSEFITDGTFEDCSVDINDIYVVTKRNIATDVSATITVTDYANIAVGTKLTFTKNDGTVITLQSEAAGGSSPSSPSGNTHFFRPNTNNDTTADNIYTALNAVSGLTVANPSANVVTVVRDVSGSENLTVTTEDSTRLATTNFVESTKHYVEKLDDDRTTDCSFQLSDGSDDGSKPTSTTVSGLGHLEGETVEVIRDDIFLGTKNVVSGEITIDQIPTTYVEVGLHYDVLAKTLPAEPRLASGTMMGRKKRIVDASPILYKTQNIAINGKEVPLKQFPYTLDSSETVFSGRKRVTPVLGFSTEAQIEITQTKPLFFTLLGLEYNVSGSQ
tara:strand:+ start:677 stop:3271 length:2595 start_codon:yes stop_codon:yes gene_type:complete